MNQRQKQMLLYMLKQEYYQPIQTICEKFGFSEKTIRNDIKAINADLKEQKLTSCIETKPGSGIRMHLDINEKEYVRYILEARMLEIQPSLERFYHGMMLLLFQSERYTMDTLADALYTNRLSLKEDIRCWESMLDTFSLTISKSDHLEIIGKEEQIRLFILYYFYQKANKVMMQIEPQLIGDHQWLFDQILHVYEHARGQLFTTNAFHQFRIYLGIMMKRIQLGHAIMIDTMPQEHYQEQVRDLLQSNFHRIISDSEMKLLEQMMESGGKQWNQEMLIQYPLSDSTIHLTKRFLTSLQHRYGIAYDPDLEMLFGILLQTARMRMNHSMRVIHYHDESVKWESMPAFLSVMRLFYEDEQLFQIPLYESEYTRLTMLLMAYFERLDKQYHYTVGLVVNCSLELAYYGRTRIMAALPQLDITHIVTADDVDHVKDQVSFFISFDYLRQQVPFVEIAPTIKDKDIQKIRQYMQDIRKEKLAKNDILQRSKKCKAGSETELIQLLYKETCTCIHDISYDQFLKIYHIQQILTQACLLLPVYDDCIQQTQIITMEFAQTLYIEGERVRKCALLCFPKGSFHELQSEVYKVKTCLKETVFSYH